MAPHIAAGRLALVSEFQLSASPCNHGTIKTSISIHLLSFSFVFFFFIVKKRAASLFLSAVDFDIVYA